MRPLGALVLACFAWGCRPDLGDPASLISGPRILAVRGDPPEAKPSDPVSYRGLVVSPAGTSVSPALLWAFCTSPKPLTDDDAVSMACLGDGVAPFGSALASAAAPTPSDACSIFGPDTPPGNYRPPDPDATGGFYQPVRAELGGLVAVRLERITCDLPDAPIAVAQELAQRYQPNHNPTLAPLSLSAGGAAIALDQVPAGRSVQLATGWGSGDAESYVMFDPDTATVVDRRESMRVSWFVTGGALTDEVTGSADDDPAITTETTWLAPDAPGVVHVWLVLRDSRGGIDFAGYDLQVR